MAQSKWIEHDGRGRPLPVGAIVDIRHFNGDVTSDFVVGSGQTFAPDGNIIAPSRARWSGWNYFDGGPMGPKFRAYRPKGNCSQHDQQAAKIKWLIAELAQAIPMLSRHELENLTERLIDRLDEIDGDPDLEDDDPAGQMDEDGINTGQAVFYLHGIAQTGPGCILSDNDSPAIGEVHPKYGEDQTQPPLGSEGRYC